MPVSDAPRGDWDRRAHNKATPRQTQADGGKTPNPRQPPCLRLIPSASLTQSQQRKNPHLHAETSNTPSQVPGDRMRKKIREVDCGRRSFITWVPPYLASVKVSHTGAAKFSECLILSVWISPDWYVKGQAGGTAVASFMGWITMSSGEQPSEPFAPSPAPFSGEAADTARRWCKVSPVNSNECLKVVFSPSLVGGSVLLQTRRDKEETGRVLASHCWPGSCPTNRMAITADFLHPSPELGLSVGALTLQYPEGERQELSNLTPLPAPKGVFSSSCWPTGALSAHSC
ncbi:hypothetical protein D4764_13G0003560 [Takifugu flavidus]|uniref:Uncharacterized protein n=1 Tax=Takifugu flavidus TaxID=433684 RepID=A0A5C6P797_9TELE|nr:hypothetical protein D4764_13G0003560 [Takifugu flavidus]